MQREVQPLEPMVAAPFAVRPLPCRRHADYNRLNSQASPAKEAHRILRGKVSEQMNSDQLTYFRLTSEEGSYSAAARKIPVSHQGLTKSLRSLERELGVILFTSDSDAGTPVPTPYAHELYEFAAVFESNVRLLKESFKRLSADERYTVRLGCSLGVLNAFGPSLLAEFKAAHPNVEVPYWESNDALCEAVLNEGRYDLAICVSPVAPGCDGVALYESPFYFWMRRDDPISQRLTAEGRTSVQIEDLQGRDIAIPGTGFKCFDQLKRVAERHGVSLGNIIEAGEIFPLYGYAMAGEALGFANGTLVDLPVFNCVDDVVAYPVEELTWGFSIEHLNTHALSEAELQLWNWFRAAARNVPGNMLGR